MKIETIDTDVVKVSKGSYEIVLTREEVNQINTAVITSITSKIGLLKPVGIVNETMKVIEKSVKDISLHLSKDCTVMDKSGRVVTNVAYSGAGVCVQYPYGVEFYKCTKSTVEYLKDLIVLKEIVS